MLSVSVAASEEVLLELKAFLENLPSLIDSAAITIAPAAYDGQLDSYLHYVSRGLFSFDRNTAALRNGHLYLLIAAPPQPILVQNLPPEIARLVGQTRWPYSLVGVIEIGLTHTTTQVLG